MPTKHILQTLSALVLSGAASLAFATPISGAVASGDLTTVLPGGVVVDFDAGPTGDFASFTSGAVTFTGIGAPLTVGSDFNGSFNTRGVNSLLTGFDLDPDAFEITLASPVSAFAFLWGASDNTWTMDVYDSANTLLESIAVSAVFASNDGDYFGATGANIARIVLTDTGDSLGVGDFVFLDNFTYLTRGDTGVPEPTTLLLMGAGLVGMGLRRRGNRV